MKELIEKKFREKRKFIITLLIASLLLIGVGVVRSKTSIDVSTPISTPICPSPLCDK